jgi:hypothetical protein
MWLHASDILAGTVCVVSTLAVAWLCHKRGLGLEAGFALLTSFLLLVVPAFYKKWCLTHSDQGRQLRSALAVVKSRSLAGIPAVFNSNFNPKANLDDVRRLRDAYASFMEWYAPQTKRYVFGCVIAMTSALVWCVGRVALAVMRNGQSGAGHVGGAPSPIDAGLQLLRKFFPNEPLVRKNFKHPYLSLISLRIPRVQSDDGNPDEPFKGETIGVSKDGKFLFVRVLGMRALPLAGHAFMLCGTAIQQILKIKAPGAETFAQDMSSGGSGGYYDRVVSRLDALLAEGDDSDPQALSSALSAAAGIVASEVDAPVERDVAVHMLVLIVMLVLMRWAARG